MASSTTHVTKPVTEILLALTLGLSGCTSEVLAPRPATTTATRAQLNYDRFGVCADLDRNVITNPVPAGEANEFTAGYNNHVRLGQTCNTEESFAFTGAFRMNLDDLHDTLIESARLSIDRRNTPIPIRVVRGVPSGVVVENSCSLRVEIATESWTPGNANGSIASRPIPSTWPVTMEQDGSIIGGGVGVQWVVQQWVLGRLPNFGFVLKPKPEDVAKNENTCTGFWFNPRLEITVARRAE